MWLRSKRDWLALFHHQARQMMVRRFVSLAASNPPPFFLLRLFFFVPHLKRVAVTTSAGLILAP